METKPTTSKEIIAYLAEKYPLCFSITGSAKPLKVGIFQDIATDLADDEQVSKTRLRQALRHYTSSWRYLKAIKNGAKRVNLQGEDVAEIDQAQADYASKTLKESQEKFANKKSQDNQPNKKYKSKKSPDSAEPEVNNKASAKQPTKTNEKFKSVKTNKSAPKKPAIVLKPMENDAIVVGKVVKVKVGNSPMDATVTEVIGKDVSVQLTSGMVVKTQIKHLFTE
jgi:ProP effector